MRITINGQEESHDEHMTVERYLALAGLDRVPCAVEINKQLVPKRDHASTSINDGDAIEIVTLVGGG